MIKKLICLLVFSVSLLFASDFQVGGYFPYWAQYSQFAPENIRFNFITDVHYGYLIPSEDGSSLAFADESDIPNFEKLISLSKDNKVQISVIIGGSGNEELMKTVASNESARGAFANTAKEFIDKNGISKVEIDWLPAEQSDFLLFDTLITSLNSVGISVSATVTGSVDAPALYTAETLNKLSAIYVMLTDQMSESESALIPNSNFKLAQDVLNAYTTAGVEGKKLVPVVPMYGKSFLNATGLGASHQGIGSGNEGIITYKELMTKFDSPDYKVSFDESTQSEVAVSATEAIVFNGIPSMKSLANFVKDQKLGGIAVFDISGDDTHPIISLLVTIGQVLRPEIKYNTKKK
ncbi:MAG TPA: glycoside hydrolase family 18 protein [Fibrobacteraceae bacterium]|nr:glycoside hydrolase family 18 protein [Fibrobacteraceae bacterium]